jgi:hypothetical protein
MSATTLLAVRYIQPKKRCSMKRRSKNKLTQLIQRVEKGERVTINLGSGLGEPQNGVDA